MQWFFTFLKIRPHQLRAKFSSFPMNLQFVYIQIEERLKLDRLLKEILSDEGVEGPQGPRYLNVSCSTWPHNRRGKCDADASLYRLQSWPSFNRECHIPLHCLFSSYRLSLLVSLQLFALISYPISKGILLPEAQTHLCKISRLLWWLVSSNRICFGTFKDHEWPREVLHLPSPTLVRSFASSIWLAFTAHFKRSHGWRELVARRCALLTLHHVSVKLVESALNWLQIIARPLSYNLIAMYRRFFILVDWSTTSFSICASAHTMFSRPLFWNKRSDGFVNSSRTGFSTDKRRFHQIEAFNRCCDSTDSCESACRRLSKLSVTGCKTSKVGLRFHQQKWENNIRPYIVL